MRARDLGISIGQGARGPNNAVTDVSGVRVGYATLIEGSDVRTGVTAILPVEGTGGVFAGTHRLNGNGEMTGWHYIREMGILASPVAITNTHSVGAVHEALIAYSVRTHTISGGFAPWALPVVGETWDGTLNDINGFHVRAEHVEAALADAHGGPIAEGNVGGGTGMICHGFKGGTGTSSRVLDESDGGYVVGVLVQANHGRRARLRVNGVSVGDRIPPEAVQFPGMSETGYRVPGAGYPLGRAGRGGVGRGEGSIIVVVATDAPLLPTQCDRLASRAALGIGRTGGLGEDSSGDLILAFATGNRIEPEADGNRPLPVCMLPNPAMNALFAAVVEATEEAIVNALVAAETMMGAGGKVAHALPHDLLKEVMQGENDARVEL